MFFGILLISQEAGSIPVSQSQNKAVPVAVTTPVDVSGQACCLLPSLTLINLKITQDISSKTAKIGDTVAMAVTVPIILNGQTLVPAGASATAEVIDVQHTGFGGKAGSLILAARFLNINDQKIALRSFQLSRVGKDNSNIAFAAGVAVGVLSLAITGTNANLPAGTPATAKIRDTVMVSPNGLTTESPSQVKAIQPNVSPPVTATAIQGESK